MYAPVCECVCVRVRAAVWQCRIPRMGAYVRAATPITECNTHTATADQKTTLAGWGIAERGGGEGKEGQLGGLT